MLKQLHLEVNHLNTIRLCFYSNYCTLAHAVCVVAKEVVEVDVLPLLSCFYVP